MPATIALIVRNKVLSAAQQAKPIATIYDGAKPPLLLIPYLFVGESKTEMFPNYEDHSVDLEVGSAAHEWDDLMGTLCLWFSTLGEVNVFLDTETISGPVITRTFSVHHYDQDPGGRA